MRIYEIPESNVEELESRLEKINKAARKTGCQEIVTKFHSVKCIRRNKRYMKVYCFSFEGSQPKLNGWTFVGKVESTEAGNVLRSFKGESIPEYFRDRASVCDHCESKRKRSSTYIVRHEDGRLFQVGKNCLKDFLGHSNPERIFAIAELFLDLESLENVDFESSTNSRIVFNTEEFIGFVFQSVADYGYKTKEKSANPTSMDAAGRMTIPDKNGKFEALSPENKEKASEALEWIRSIEASSSFEKNMQIYSNLPYLKMEQLGIAAYIVAAYLKHLGKEIYKKKAKAEDKGFFGEIGNRYELELEVVSEKVIDIESQFASETHIYNFISSDGKCFVMFSNPKRYNVGDKIKIKATVVKHSTFANISQTTINRPKLIGVNNE